MFGSRQEVNSVPSGKHFLWPWDGRVNKPVCNGSSGPPTAWQFNKYHCFMDMFISGCRQSFWPAPSRNRTWQGEGTTFFWHSAIIHAFCIGAVCCGDRFRRILNNWDGAIFLSDTPTDEDGWKLMDKRRNYLNVVFLWLFLRALR